MTLEILQAKAAQSHAPPSPRTWAEEDVLEVPHLCLLSNGPAAAVHDVYNVRAHAPHIALARKPPGDIEPQSTQDACMKAFGSELSLAAKSKHSLHEVRAAPLPAVHLLQRRHLWQLSRHLGAQQASMA